MSEHIERNAIEEQGIAAWISYLNQLRETKLVNNLDEIQRTLNEAVKGQKKNLADALTSLDTAMDEIQRTIIDTNRGGGRGMHGFIAETAQVGIGNARERVQGSSIIWKWLNNNGQWDLLKIDPVAGTATPVQQKFTKTAQVLNDLTGKKNGVSDPLSLKSLLGHLQDYPDSLDVGGKYMIPKDHYKKLLRLVSMTEQEANRLPTATGEFSLKEWRDVQEFVKKGRIPLEKIIPSDLDYSEVQRGKVFDTLAKERANIRDISSQIEEKNTAEAGRRVDAAYKESQPTWGEAAKVTAIGAALEGFMALLMTYTRIRREKRLDEFTDEDWKELGLNTGKGSAGGAIRGAAVYGLTNFTPVPASLASGLVTAVLSVTELAYSYHKGSINKEEFLTLTEAACMDAAVSSISALIGEVLIPVPYLGALIGTVAGKLASEIVKKYCAESEQYTIIGCQKEFEQACMRFGEEYAALTSRLASQLSHYRDMISMMLDEEANLAFYQSAELADSVGVDPEKILRTKQDIDKYFEN